MENILNKIYITYKTELVNYKYCDNENINDIPKGSHIIYISKNNLLKKSGFLKDIKDNTILELININKKGKWYIYIDQYYIFYKNPGTNSLKNTLKSLVDNNFTINIRKN
jgi:hypothetical protein